MPSEQKGGEDASTLYQKLRGEIFSSCEVLEERADAEGAFFRFRASADTVARLTKLAVDA